MMTLDEQRAYYALLLAEHGDSSRALDWSADGQRARFRVLCDLGIKNGDSVLDVGCGLGHFYRYLCDHGCRHVQYIGIDVSSASITFARQTFPEAEFFEGDVFVGNLLRADYVVASGVLNVEQGDNEEAMRRLFTICFDACRVAVAINMLSTLAARRRDDRHYFEPTWAFNCALRLTPRVTLRHDYRGNDLTVYLYR